MEYDDDKPDLMDYIIMGLVLLDIAIQLNN